MAKKPDSDQKERKLHGEKAVSRRDFVKTGAVAGVGAAAGVGDDRPVDVGNGFIAGFPRRRHSMDTTRLMSS